MYKCYSYWHVTVHKVYVYSFLIEKSSKQCCCVHYPKDNRFSAIEHEM